MMRFLSCSALILISCLAGACTETLPPDAEAFTPAAWAAPSAVLADSAGWPLPGATAPGDLDGDGDLDLAAVGPCRIAWFENLGGSPPAFRMRPIDDRGTANALLVLDGDGDGDLDLVSAAGCGPDGREQPGPLMMWRNPGDRDGAWEALFLDAEPGNFLHDLAAADLDGDGRVEIVAPRGAAYLDGNRDHDYIALYRRREVPTGSEPKTCVGSSDAGWERILLRGPDGPARPEDFGLALGDLDGDGFTDVIQFRTCWLHPGRDVDGIWRPVPWTEDAAPSNLVCLDLDNDGDSDLAFAEGHAHRVGRSRVGWWRNDTEPGGDPEGDVLYIGKVPQDPENLACADLDGNGIPDLVTGAMNWRNPPASLDAPSWNDRDGNLVIFAGMPGPGDGDPVFARCIVRKGIAALHHLVLADFDGDGDLDVAGETAGAKPPSCAPDPRDPGLVEKIVTGAIFHRVKNSTCHYFLHQAMKRSRHRTARSMVRKVGTPPASSRSESAS